MKPIYSKAQLGYMKSKTHFEKQAAILEKEIEKTKKTQPISQEVMEELVQKTGFHDAYNNLVLSENELIDWSHVTIKHEKEYKDNKQAIEDMYTNLNTDPQLRARIIDLAMKIK